MFVSAFMVTRRAALDGSLPGNRSIADNGWGANRSYISDEQKNPHASFSGFNIDNLTKNIRNLPDVKSMLVSHTKHMTDCLQRVSGGFFPSDRSMQR